MLYVLILFVMILIIIDLYFNYNEKIRVLRKIPGPECKFIVGHALEILTTPVKVFGLIRKSNSQWKRIHSFWAFSHVAINLQTPEDIKQILSTTKHNEKCITYTFLKPWLQDGLLLSDGQKWQDRRKILTPAFHFSILHKFCLAFEENSLKMVEALESCVDKKTDVIPIISQFTLNSICETAMGTHFSEEMSGDGLSYKSAIYELGKTFIQRTTRIFLHPDLIFNLSTIGKKQRECIKIIHTFTKKVIEVKKREVELNIPLDEADKDLSGNKQNTALLDLLISAQKEKLIDDTGIQEEVDTFMFEGHDTTATGLTYCLMLLANHKDVQNKIFEELYDIFGNSNRGATYEDLSKMKYLERVIKESLRLYPPVPIICRHIKEPITIGEYKIPGNVYCYIHIYDLHRRQDLYPNPLEFDPDRFLPENSVGRHPFAYIPFSAGPRNCIGQKFAMMEMKSAVSAIIRSFQLEPNTRPSDLRIAVDLVLRNSEPVFVTFKKRI